MSNKSIVFEHVNKSFKDKKVIKDFSYNFIKGEKVFIKGDSGSGKSTLINLLCSFMKPDSGVVSKTEKIRLSVVFQEDRLCENISALSNIVFATSVKPEVAFRELQLMGLEGSQTNLVSSLSGGMKRRVAIARALLSEGDFLILDEPFKGLDDQTKIKVMKRVYEKLNGRGLILITHDSTEAQFFNIKNVINL